MTKPWLLLPDSLNRVSPDELFSTHAAKHFGELARALPSLAPNALLQAQNRIDHRPGWRRLISEELLLAHNSGTPLDEQLLEHFGTEHPLGGDLPGLRALLNVRAAAAVFPVTPQECAATMPLWRRLWVLPIRGHPDHRLRFSEFESAEALFGQELGLFIPHDTPGNPIIGRSWQLAAALALCAQRHDDRTLTLRVARDWAATGAVDADRKTITGVQIGVKLAQANDRKWLLPEKNRIDIPVGFQPSQGFWMASTVDVAWGHIADDGIVEGGEAHPPDPGGEFHSFVSEGLGPLLASALLVRPRRIVLWHTSSELKSRNPAEAVKRALAVVLPGNVEIHLEEVSSESLIKAERKLRTLLKPVLQNGTGIIFNVTQGNRLMSFAIHNLARLHANIRLIYRDFDEPNRSTFVQMQYLGWQPTTSRMDLRVWEEAVAASCKRTPRWEAFFSKPTPPVSKAVEDQTRLILSHFFSGGPENPVPDHFK